MMEIKFDRQVDALYVRVKKGKVHKTISHDGFILDMDRKGEVVGIEVLEYSKTTKSEPGRYSVSFIDDGKLVAA